MALSTCMSTSPKVDSALTLNARDSIADWQLFMHLKVSASIDSTLAFFIQCHVYSFGNMNLFTHFTPAVLNKFKRRKFLKTKNLLTGETEADPEMIKVICKC